MNRLSLLRKLKRPAKGSRILMLGLDNVFIKATASTPTTNFGLSSTNQYNRTFLTTTTLVNKNNNNVIDILSGSYGGSSIGCTSNSNSVFAHHIRTIKTKSSAKKRFLKRGNGSIKRWKQGRRHLNYNQRRKKLLQSLSSVQLKTCDKKVMRKLLNCKIK